MREPWDFDRDPLVALRHGDPGPFEAFVTSETTTFLGFYLRLGAKRPEAEDLVQELFMKLFRHAETYRPQDRFAAFAYRVARNAWIDRQRRSARAEDLTQTLAASEEARQRSQESRSEWPVSELAQREEIERLNEALGELPEHHRMVFDLGVRQELPYAEISALLEIPIGTVKSRMFHAVRKLREALEGDFRAEPRSEPRPEQGPTLREKRA